MNLKLTEIKNKRVHYFEDEQGRLQGEYKLWHRSGQLSTMAHLRDGKIHGEYKSWDSFGKLDDHTFDIGGKEVIDFLKNPEQYPTTPEEKTMFALKYGNAPFISEGESK